MEIKINGEVIAIDGEISVGSFLEMQNQPSAGIAVALNGKLVRRDQWQHTMLQDKDDLVIIKAAYGG